MQHATCVLPAERTPSHLSHAACTVPVGIAADLLGIFAIGDRWRVLMSLCEFRKRERVGCEPIDVRDDDVLQFCGMSACVRVHISKEYFQTTHMHCMSLACFEH